MNEAERNAIDEAARRDHLAAGLPPIGPGQAAGLRRVLVLGFKRDARLTARAALSVSHPEGG
jgi:hypothetical protein